MKTPRLKLYKQVDGFKVYIVDGAVIRKNIEPDFTNFGQHYRFNFIPVNEFWVDRSKGHDEYEFYIQNMLIENDLMEKGYSYDNAHKLSCEKESELRKSQPKKDIKVGVLKKIGDVTVYLVDGEQVRNRYNVDFTQGGHDAVYSWIPQSEVWIDNDVPVEERDEIVLHECYERDKMESGRRYIPTHKEALKIENEYRKTNKMPKKYKGLIPRLVNRLRRE